MINKMRHNSLRLIVAATCAFTFASGINAEDKPTENKNATWNIKEIKSDARKKAEALAAKEKAAKEAETAKKAEEQKLKAAKEQADRENEQLQAQIAKMQEEMVSLKLQQIKEKLQLIQGEIKRDEGVSDRVARMLDKIVIEAREAVKGTISQKQKVTALSIEVSVYDILARNTINTQKLEKAGEHISNLIASSRKLIKLNRPNGKVRGEFWQLQAQLMDNQRSQQMIQQRSAQLGKIDLRSTSAYWQNKSIQQIEQAAKQIEDIDAKTNGRPMNQNVRSDMGREIVEIHKVVKLGLLSLYAQSGQTQKSGILLDEIQLRWPDDQKVKQGVIDAEAMAEMFGEKLNFQIQTLSGKTWKPEDYPNKRKVIVFTDARMLAGKEWEEMRLWLYKISQKHNTTGAPVLQVVASEQNINIKNSLNVDSYHLAKIRLSENDIVGKLGITSLPWVIVLNQENKVQALGQSAGIFLNQFNDINKKPEVDPITIGKQLNVKLSPLKGSGWNSTEHKNKVVLMYFATKAESKKQFSEALKPLIETYSQPHLQKHLEIICVTPTNSSVQGEMLFSEDMKPWNSCLISGYTAQELLAAIDVKTFPTLVIADKGGMVRYISKDIESLKHINKLIPPKPQSKPASKPSDNASKKPADQSKEKKPVKQPFVLPSSLMDSKDDKK
ncbi:hypothetical protein JD969_13040 [Planctomycetota bacterium]|nr:hypothetical protein JD969_13040 [Planctomycetota bacterium]